GCSLHHLRASLLARRVAVAVSSLAEDDLSLGYCSRLRRREQRRQPRSLRGLAVCGCVGWLEDPGGRDRAGAVARAVLIVVGVVEQLAAVDKRGRAAAVGVGR